MSRAPFTGLLLAALFSLAAWAGIVWLFLAAVGRMGEHEAVVAHRIIAAVLVLCGLAIVAVVIVGARAVRKTDVDDLV